MKTKTQIIFTILTSIVCMALIAGASTAFAFWVAGTKSDSQTLNVGTKEIVVDLGAASVAGTNEFYPGSYMEFTYTVEIKDTASDAPVTDANIAASVTAVGEGTDVAADFFDVTVSGNATEGKVVNGETVTIRVAMKADAQKPDFSMFTLSVVLS